MKASLKYRDTSVLSTSYQQILLKVDSFRKDTINTRVYIKDQPDDAVIRWVTILGPVVSIIGLFFVWIQIRGAQNQVKENFEMRLKLAEKNYNDRLRILRLTTNADIINELHFKLTAETLKFHNTSVQELTDCGFGIDEFIYVLNIFLASEFYYDDFLKEDDILKDLSLYRMYFLNHDNIKNLWNKVIKGKWSMAPVFVTAIDTFYLDPKLYIERKQGTVTNDAPDTA